MKSEITLPIAELKEVLPGLKKITGNSRTLPVLNTVRISRTPEGVVTLSATDLDAYLTYKARELQPGEPEDMLIPMDQLAKAAKCSPPKEELGIVAEAKDKLKIRYNIAGNRVEQTITTLPVEEYPPVPTINQPAAHLEPGFGRALREALDCCSQDASRYVLRGACLDVSDSKYHYVVGTNGRFLFSANSFCFNLQKSVIIPESKFLNWSDFLDDEPAALSIEPGLEAKEAKDGQPAQEATAGWVKLESPRWTYVTKEIEGQFPNWRQCVPTTNGKWTRAILADEAAKQLILVIPNLPGGNDPNSGVRLRVDQNQVIVEGKGKDEESWTSIPVSAVKVEGNPATITVNREYLLMGLRFGLTELEIEDPLSPMVMRKGGKKMVIMPLRPDYTPEAPPAAGQDSPATTDTSTTPTTEQTEPQPNAEAPTEERTEMPRTIKATTTEPTGTETTTPEVNATEKQKANGTNGNTINGATSLGEQVDQIKETLKAAIRQLATIVDAVKQADKEKRAAEKEIDAIRTKLRQIQSVSI